MIIKYRTEVLTRIIKDIFDLTGMSISILDTNYNVLTSCAKDDDFCSYMQRDINEKMKCVMCDKKVLEKCRKSKKLERHICRAGLYDCAMPIVKDGIVVGFAIMGKVRSVDSPKHPQYPETDSSQNFEKLARLYSEIPYIDEKRLMALYDLLVFILFDGAIQIVYSSFVNDVVNYIDKNLKADLRIESLCEKFHVSKNSLYEGFRNNLGTTVNEYINTQRINSAKKYLENSNDTVYAIAEKVGIQNYTYFCKLFKKRTGVTPIQYRKEFL